MQENGSREQETKEAKAAQQSQSGSGEGTVSSGLAGKRKKLGTGAWIAAAVVVVAAAVVIGILVYINSPSYQARKALEEGERYLEDMDYDRAIAKFIDALKIDPANTEITAAIYGHLEEFLVSAQGRGEAGDYNAERQIASYVLTFDADNDQGQDLLAVLPEGMEDDRLFEEARDLIRDGDKQELLEHADQDFSDRNYVQAQEEYEQAKEKGAVDSEVEPRLSLCVQYQKVLDLCEVRDWNGLQEYMDSEEFNTIVDYMESADPQYASRGEVNVLIGEKEGTYYVVTGDLTSDNGSGQATGVLSSANTYAIYMGEWTDYVPNGKGYLTVWYKNEAMEDGNLYDGTFQDGLVEGKATLRTPVDGAAKTLDLTLDSGAIQLFHVDEDGNLWLSDVKNSLTYTIVDVKEADGKVTDYVAGVPGFGGSDARATVHSLIVDTEPPVITCSLKKEKWMDARKSGVPIGEGITATDNVDGDITDRITYTSTRSKTDEQIQSERKYGFTYDNDLDWWHKLTVVYTVSDAAGNTASLTVVYEFLDECGRQSYQVLSIK